MSLTIIWEVALGAIIALACIYIFRSKNIRKEVIAWGYGLVIAAIVYLIFAEMNKEPTWIYIELGGVVLFSLFLWFAKKWNLLFVPVGWLLHMVWDTLLHIVVDPGYAPDWYPDLCIGFDVVIAIYLFRIIKR